MSPFISCFVVKPFPTYCCKPWKKRISAVLCSFYFVFKVCYCNMLNCSKLKNEKLTFCMQFACVFHKSHFLFCSWRYLFHPVHAGVFLCVVFLVVCVRFVFFFFSFCVCACFLPWGSVKLCFQRQFKRSTT